MDVGEHILVPASVYHITPRSVADPRCLSRILNFIHLGSRIQKQQQKRGKVIVLPFFAATNITKLKIILFLSR